MKLIEIEEKLGAQGLTLFTSRELSRAARISPISAKFLLIRYTKNGFIRKLKNRRGLYCFRRTLPHPWQLANRLLRPSYISFETALSYFGAFPESVYEITSATIKTTRTFQALDTTFTYHKLKKEAFHSYQSIEMGGTTVYLAEKEKALADYLYFVHLKKKTLNERLRWVLFDETKIIRHLKTFGRKNLVAWAQHVIRNHR